MFKKIKNAIIYVIVGIVVFYSFKMPEEDLLKSETIDIETVVHKKDKNQIDVEAEKIYLVNAIHSIEGENSTIEITSGDNKYIIISESSSNESYTDEMKKLQEYEIIKDETIETNHEYGIGIIDRAYQNNENKYVVSSITISYSDETDNSKKTYVINVENKTGKILSINFEKEKLNKEIEKEEIMRNYIKYLDLYIIDDWKFENNTLSSDKAKLKVNLYEIGNRYLLSINSTETNVGKYREVIYKESSK